MRGEEWVDYCVDFQRRSSRGDGKIMPIFVMSTSTTLFGTQLLHKLRDTCVWALQKCTGTIRDIFVYILTILAALLVQCKSVWTLQAIPFLARPLLKVTKTRLLQTPCLRLHVTSWEPLNGFPLNLILVSFYKLRSQNLIFVKIGQKCMRHKSISATISVNLGVYRYEGYEHRSYWKMKHTFYAQ
jgi:hypothetical protein